MSSATRSKTEPTYDDFWLNYLRAHSRRLTRQIHYTGITVIFIGIIAAIWLTDWRIAAAGVVLGYIIAWAAHFTVQGNEPVMFKSGKSAAWSLMSGLKMYVLGISFRLKPELRRAGVKTG